jgi:CubicO group peptidase (beta-lactamase class C family)
MKNLILIIFLALSTQTFAQVQQKVIDSLFDGKNGIRTAAQGTGLVIGINHNGKATYYAIGTRSASGSEPLDSATIFEVGSATKTFTGLLLALNIEEGKIGLNDNIDSYLPGRLQLPESYRNKVKLTDLASHQSGLPNLSSDKYFTELMKKDPRNPFRFVDRKYLYDVLRQTDTLTHYGDYQYNNYAYSLLGDLIGRKNKQAYTSLIKRDILGPLQMKSTTFETPKSLNIAGLYDQRGVPQESMILDAAMPAGGLKSNAVDLLKYLAAQISPPVELKSAIDLTQKNYYKDSEREIGLGWDIKDDYYQKDGDTFGNSCLLRFSKKRNLAIVVLSNHQNGKLVRDAVDYLYSQLSK